MTSATITIRLDESEKEKLARLAAHTSRSKSYLAGKAISDYVDRELAIIEGIEAGLDDMRAGRVLSHEDAMSRIRRAIGDA